MRVHELAKELGLSSSKELLAHLQEMGAIGKSASSSLTREQILSAREKFGKRVSAPVAAPVAPPPASTLPAPEAAKPAPVAVEEKPAEAEAAEATPGVILVRGPIVVKEFAAQLGVKPNQLIAELMGMNVFASINQKIDLKVAQQVAERRGFTLEQEKKPVEKKSAPKPKLPEPEPTEDRNEDLLSRPPVVAFLGHVDHGKTSLLDHIRHAQVAAGEDGGITQHIGAYTVEVNDQCITFLDTPGHEAFTAMRARGANLTDIVVLIVAADDGVMPQTREAIQHAKAANVTIMVAINKIDLPGANPDRVMKQLQQEGLAPEQWGGNIICCPVSAVTGEGVEHLLEMILLQAEVLELKANPSRKGQGYVVEAQLEPGMGPTSTMLVRKGTLHVGDAVVCGTAWGRVKALINDKGIKVRTAGPSLAVKCLGLTDVPLAGAEFKVVANDRVAREEAEKLIDQKRRADLTAPRRASLDDLFNQTAPVDKLELAAILKTDVQGSLEAIQQALESIKSEKVALRFILVGVGNISVNDVLLASASNAIILGFHVSVDGQASSMAKREGVEIRLYSIIYEIVDDVRRAMTGLLRPETRERVQGHAEVRQVFELSKKGRVAGCMIVDGFASSRAKARVKRRGEIIYEGTLSSLKRFQDDASEVRQGQECGIRVDSFQDYQVGDIIEMYEIEKIAAAL